MNGETPGRTRVGIIGCGDIFERYVRGMRRFRQLEVVGCADVDLARAEAGAARMGLPAWSGVEEFLAGPGVELAVVLTPPQTHAPVVSDALAAGKHVYVEKPLATELDDARRMIERAHENRRRLASAPDTFLGDACQTARAVIDSGEIGEVIGGAAFITHNYVETRHPDPTAFFKPGGGPLLDLGPYYMTQLINCLGPVQEVSGRTRIGQKQRRVTSPNRRVDVVDVEVPTHTSGIAQFASGAIVTLMMSFDIWARSLPPIEIYGTRGQLQLPDPNRFGGEVMLVRPGGEWQVVPSVIPSLAAADTTEQLQRGLGVADLAASLPDREPRASSTLALHVLEALSAVQLSSDSGAVVQLTTSCARPEPLDAAELERWDARRDGDAKDAISGVTESA